MEMQSSSLIEMGTKQPNGCLERSSSNGSQSATKFRPIPKPRKSLMKNNCENGRSTPKTLDLPSTPSPPTIHPHCFLPLPPTPVLTPPPLPPRVPYCSSNSSQMSPLLPLPVSIKQQNSNEILPNSPSENDLDFIKISPESPKISPLDSFRIGWKLGVENSENNNNNNNNYTTLINSTIPDTPLPNISSLSLEKQKVDGEMICFSGWVQLFPSGGKDSSTTLSKKEDSSKKRCWALIRHNQLCFMEDDESEVMFRGPYDLYRCILASKNIKNFEELVLMVREVTVNNNNNKNSTAWNTIRFQPEQNLEFWLVLLAKCHCLPSENLQNSLTQLDLGGKLWIKQGIGGIWMEGWAHIRQRILYYWIQGFDAIFETNIRKIILIKRDVPLADYCNHIENSSNGPILIAQDGSSLYLQAESDSATEFWFEFLNFELKNNGKNLEENRLTGDDVPVIVDKCIKLIATYGLYQPGIYRKNGSAAKARDLFKSFKEDPYNVHMQSLSDESINAVADILRSFFRQLEDPLIPTQFHEELYKISDLSDTQQKMNAYKEIVFNLPKVYFSTLKRLLAHLQEITAHCAKNLASVENIAKVFGPTIFCVDKCDEKVSIDSYQKTARQIAVMRELLTNFDVIFQISDEEINAKTKLDEIQENKQNPKARAEGFLVPIHLFEKDNKCFNVRTEWTAGQVVDFKMDKLDDPHLLFLPESYALFEVVKNGQLERRIGADEVLTSIVLGRWLDWEYSECYLLLKKDSYPFQQNNVRPFADDIKFAENGSKSFKTSQLRVESGTKVVQYSKNMKQINEWVVDEMLWFLGHESERKPPHPYTLTFFLTGSTATKYKCKFSGFCAAFRDEVQRAQWLNSVIVCKQEYLPTPLIHL